jgi:uncharacterized membrane protein YagU involved in acid resistance
MSTLAYAALTTSRENAVRKNAPPSVSTYVDALAALVPAEALALHAVILSVTTKTTDGTTKITAQGTLFGAFVGLILLSIGLYVGYRLLAKKWDKLDYFRMLIPPLAFVGWTMLQRATAFDAVFPKLAEAPRTVVALFLSVILGVAAAFLAYQANQNPTPPRNK